MKEYSVLLLYPDYVAENYGEDSYLTTVDAESPEDAVGRAQDRCMQDHFLGEDSAINEPEDLAILLVCEGRIFDLWQR